MLYLIFQDAFITFDLIGRSLGTHYFDIKRVDANTMDVYIKNSLLEGFRNIEQFKVTVMIESDINIILFSRRDLKSCCFDII